MLRTGSSLKKKPKYLVYLLDGLLKKRKEGRKKRKKKGRKMEKKKENFNKKYS